MTAMVQRAPGRAIARGWGVARRAAWVDPRTIEAIRLLATILVIVIAFAGVVGMGVVIGPMGIPPEGPTPGGP